MLDPKRTAIIFTANTPHVAQANLMIDSLFDTNQGNFKGDLWVISTHLSQRCMLYLESRNIKFMIDPLLEMNSWEYRNIVSIKQSSNKNRNLNSVFDLYKNKRMSKLIICNWVKKFGRNYDMIALCDNDLYFQNDINLLFSENYNYKDFILYWHEEYKIVPGTALWNKNFHYSRFHNATGLDFGEYEINIGFIMSSPEVIFKLFYEVKTLFSRCHCSLFADYYWHDQDLVRLIRAKSPNRFKLFNEGDIVHLCNGGTDVVDEIYPSEFYHKKTKTKPTIIHFAGGTWKKYLSINKSYAVNEGIYYFMKEQTEIYDPIRSLTAFDPLMVESPYFSRHNIESREKARDYWIAIRQKSTKKSMLFFSWLDTSAHKPVFSQIKKILQSKIFDLMIIDGNVHHNDYNNFVVEDLPDILTFVTKYIKDPIIATNLGYHNPKLNIYYKESLSALQKEYHCSERNAKAMIYIYSICLKEILQFYNPDIVIGWGAFLPSNRILKVLCKELGIKYITMELGVLPTTIAFDCLGHMGASWVAQYFKEFNRLELSEHDKNNASNFLEFFNKNHYSRICSFEPSKKSKEKLEFLNNLSKKIVLYVGSNDAQSGNTPYNESTQYLHSPFFADNNEVIKHLSLEFADIENIQIVYKPHPITITRGLDLDEEYDNIFILTEAITLEDCIQIADVVVVNVSQSCYETLLREKPVVMIGINQINYSGAAYVIKEKNNLKLTILQALKFGYTNNQKILFRDHVARLLKYYLFNTTNDIGAEFAQPQEYLPITIYNLLIGSYPSYLKYEKESLDIYNVKLYHELEYFPFISVIMPVYNGEKYLSDSISSVLNQSFTNIELICINNGSTDSSQKIIDYFSKNDHRVISIFQNEPNQRKARNLGVEKAKGKYLHFIDCDDLIEPDTYEYLYNVAEKLSSDILYFYYKEMHGTIKMSRPRYKDYTCFLPQDEIFKMEKKFIPFFAQYPFPWAKFFNKSFFVNNNLYFRLDCSNYDDNPQNLLSLLTAHNIYVCNRYFYKFRINPESMTQSKNDRALGMIDAVRIMNETYKNFNCYEEYQQFYVLYKIHILYFAFTKMPEKLLKEYINLIKNLFYPTDSQYFRKNSEIAFFTYMSEEKIKFIEEALIGNIEKCLEMYNNLNKTKKENIKLYPNKIEELLAVTLIKILKNYPKFFRLIQKCYRSIRPLSGYN